MIVSGFTQSRNTGDVGILYGPFDHRHCATCIRRACNVRPDDVSSCKMVDCPRGCPARYHACKDSEHVLLCAEDRVACVNQGNGCPVVLARSKINRHLATCPASVVFCTAEWNRSPLCPPRAGEKPYLPKTKKLIDCAQLDVALAMRDHRALIDMLHAPRRTRHILRNPLTQRYPAAPFGRCSSQESDVAGSEDTMIYNSDDDTDPPWDSAQPWLASRSGSRHRSLYQTSLTQPSVSDNLDFQVMSSRGSITDRADINAQHGTVTYEPQVAGPELMIHGDGAAGSDQTDDAASRLTLDGTGMTPGEEAAGVCVQCMSAGEGVASQSSQGTDEAGPSMSAEVRSSDAEIKIDSGCEPHIKAIQPSDKGVGGAGITGVAGSNKGAVDGIPPKTVNALKKTMDTSNLNGSPLSKILGVNLGVECITKYQPKQSYMYTFLCGQEFRRDQFASHFHNVHNEIQSGLGGWMEQRCPLAYLGCPFSFRRFCPDTPELSVCHSWLHESFGLQSRYPGESPSHQTPQYLIPASVVATGWSSAVDDSEKPSTTHSELSHLHPECFTSGQELSTDEQPDDVHPSSPTDASNTHVAEEDEECTGVITCNANRSETKQGNTDSGTSVVASGSSFAHTEDKAATTETDSISELLDSMIHDDCVDLAQCQGLHATVEPGPETSCDRQTLSGAGLDDSGGQTWHIQKCYKMKLENAKLMSEEGQTSTQASGSQASISPASSQSIWSGWQAGEAKPPDSRQQLCVPPDEASSIEQPLCRPVLYTGAAPTSSILLDYKDDSCLSAADQADTAGEQQLHLTDLPTEILQHITRFLDSFSLYNVSLVSRMLRDICCSLLDERGIVSLIWERKRNGPGSSWEVVRKRWSFSLSFQEVRTWRFSGHNPISPHLLTCPYNRDLVVRTERFSIIPQHETPSHQQIRDYLSDKQPRQPRYSLPSIVVWSGHSGDLPQFPLL